MYRVELYARVRRACHVEGMSTREASRVFGVDRKTVRKMLSFSVPPGYRRSAPPRRPKLGPFTGIIDRILEDDRTSHRKQRHTAKRIFDRLRDEYGFTGGYTIVKDYVREQGLRSREVFVPLSHSPGHAQADFGEAMAVIGGALRKIHFLAFDLPHSDGCFVAAYPAETTEAFCDGHNAAFAFFGGVPRSILYDNTKLAVARILGDGKRQRPKHSAMATTRRLPSSAASPDPSCTTTPSWRLPGSWAMGSGSERASSRSSVEALLPWLYQSHYLFEDRFGRPGKGNDKGKVEGLVGFIRRNFLVPVPRARGHPAELPGPRPACLLSFYDFPATSTGSTSAPPTPSNSAAGARVRLRTAEDQGVPEPQGRRIGMSLQTDLECQARASRPSTMLSPNSAAGARRRGCGATRRPSASVSSGIVKFSCHCRLLPMMPAISALDGRVRCRWCVTAATTIPCPWPTATVRCSSGATSMRW